MNVKLFSVLVILLSILYLSNPREDIHRQAVAKFIKDHYRIEEEEQISQFVTDGLYYKNYFFFSSCTWNGEILLSTGCLFRASVKDDKQRRKILAENCADFFSLSPRVKSWRFDSEKNADP